MTEQTAREAADAIIEDLCSRGGGDGWFDSIDPDTQEEIRVAWTNLILQHAHPA